jgi:drug/metabolite transporter (DMT)-like permease
LSLKIFALIVLNDLADSVSQLFMKKGLVKVEVGSIGFDNLLQFVSQNISSAMLWLGILIYILGFFLWIVVLSRMDVSIALPVEAYAT